MNNENEPDDSLFLKHWDTVSHEYGFGAEYDGAYRSARTAWFAALAAQPAEQASAGSIGDDAEFQRHVDNIYTAMGSRSRREATAQLAAYIDSRPRQAAQRAPSDTQGAEVELQIPTWKERLFADQPELKGQFPDDSGFYDEVGSQFKDEEIADLRTVLAQQAPDAVRDGALEDAVAALTDDQRLELFGKYCKSCGRQDPGCQCWNDE